METVFTDITTIMIFSLCINSIYLYFKKDRAKGCYEPVTIAVCVISILSVVAAILLQPKAPSSKSKVSDSKSVTSKRGTICPATIGASRSAGIIGFVGNRVVQSEEVES